MIYREEYIDQVVSVIISGKSLGAWRQKAGVPRGDFYNWRKLYPGFNDAVSDAWDIFRARVPFRKEYIGEVIDTHIGGGNLAEWRRKIGVPKEEFRRWCRSNYDFNEAVRNTSIAKSATYHKRYLDEILGLVTKGGNLASWREQNQVSIVEWRRWCKEIPDFDRSIKEAIENFDG